MTFYDELYVALQQTGPTSATPSLETLGKIETGGFQSKRGLLTYHREVRHVTSLRKVIVISLWRQYWIFKREFYVVSSINGG